MARLPSVGGDNGSWGQILNDYLSQSHTLDGNLKSGVVSTDNLQDNAVAAGKLSSSVQSSLTKADSAVQSINAKFPNSGNVTLTAGDVGSIPASLVDLGGDPISNKELRVVLDADGNIDDLLIVERSV